MSNIEPAARAPRLTETRLDDLDVAVKAIDENLEYLVDAVTHHPKGSTIHTYLATKLEQLTRARAWIAGKVAAERAQRGDA